MTNVIDKQQKTAICYFSGTGNSQDVSTRLLSLIPNSTLYKLSNINDVAILSEYSKIGVVCPVHAFNLPDFVKDFILRLSEIEDKDSKYFFVILTFGGTSAGMLPRIKALFNKQGLILSYAASIMMPVNFTILPIMPNFILPNFWKNFTLKRSIKKVENIANNINNNVHLIIRPSGAVIASDGMLKKLAKSFKVTDNCNGCGKCVANCPTRNIALENCKPVFFDNCAACLACYHRCPQNAIYFQSGKPKRQYVNPNVKDW